MKKESNSKKRTKKDLFLKLPARVLQDRSVAVLEAIVEYLKDEQDMKYSEIAKLLNRNVRTIWTVYSRVDQGGTVYGLQARCMSPKGGNSRSFYPIRCILQRTTSLLCHRL